MTPTEYLLTKLANECIGVANACHKAMLYGLAEGVPGTHRTNQGDIASRMNDVRAVLTLLKDVKVDIPFDREHITAKQEKTVHQIGRAIDRGIVHLPHSPTRPSGQRSA